MLDKEFERKSTGLKGWLRGSIDEEKLARKSSEAEFDKTRIAIVPFSNISPDPSDEYFADGLTEELISTMSKIGGFKVIARTSILRYKHSDKSISDIAGELEVGSVLEGTVRKSGNKLRITAQLIDSMRSENLWAESYDRDLVDIFEIQSEIARQVSEALKVKLFSAETVDIERRPTRSSQAYTLYLKGRNQWNQRTKSSLALAQKHFEEAIKLDDEYALGYAGLADCYIISGDRGLFRPKEVFPRAKENAAKAIELDPRLAEAHVSLAAVYFHYEWKWADAEKEFKKAIELKPSYATAYHWYSLYLQFMDRLDEALLNIKKAYELDPLSRIIGCNLADRLLFSGRHSEALEILHEVLEENPGWQDGHSFLGFANLVASNKDDAIIEFRKGTEGNDPQSMVRQAYSLGLCGRTEETNSLLHELKETTKTTYVPSIYLALAMFSVGRLDEGFVYLEKSYEEKSCTMDHGQSLWFLRKLPGFEQVRNDRRLNTFEKRLGLLEFWGGGLGPS